MMMIEGFQSQFGGAINMVNSALIKKFGKRTGRSLSQIGMNASVGAGGGAIGGGVYGAFSDNESVLGGAAKGGLMGAAGAAIGSAYMERGNLGELTAVLNPANKPSFNGWR